MIPVICRNTFLSLGVNQIRQIPQIRYISSCSVLSNSNISSFKNVNVQMANSYCNTSMSNKYKNGPLNVMSVRQISLTPNRMSAADHSKLWTVERAVAISLLASLPVALAIPHPVLDTVAAISIVMHQYWGFEAIVTDYVRPIIVGPVIPKITHGLLIALTLATLGGLFYFNYNDVGISRAVRRLWTLNKDKQQ